MRKIHIVSASLLLLISPSLWSQESQALGDVARRLRAEKTDKPSALRVPTAKPPAAVDLAVSATLDSAAITGQKEIEDYKLQVQKLFQQEKFDELDRMAGTARSTKARFAGGGWKLYGFYGEISKKPEGSDVEWNASLARLKRWISAKPESIAPRIALADLYLAYAWSARGDGYADTVSESGGKLFKQRTQQAREILERAAALNEKCPHWYWVMQTVALAQGWSKAEAESLLQKATAFEPGYYYYYQSQARFLLPKWNGEEGDSEAFANTIADQLGGKLGDITYYKVARDMVCDCAEQLAPQKVSWLRIRRGYEFNEQGYGASMYELNAFARMSVKFGDADTANKLFARIGENWDETVWNSKKYFDDCRSWATEEVAARNSALDQIASAVKANLKTPEGQAYDATIAREFGHNFASAMSDCVKVAGNDLQDFTLYLRVGNDGRVSAIVPRPVTKVNACLAPKVYATTFSIPPGPAYWVQIAMSIKP